MDKNKIKVNKRKKRRGRIRVKISGTRERPRLSVFRSLKDIYAQLIDDKSGKTLVSASSREIKKQEIKKLRDEKDAGKIIIAKKVGELVAKKAVAAGIKEVVFDRGGYKYHGRVKALADGARSGGLKF